MELCYHAKNFPNAPRIGTKSEKERKLYRPIAPVLCHILILQYFASGLGLRHFFYFTNGKMVSGIFDVYIRMHLFQASLSQRLIDIHQA